ncbi:hypothetical protein OAA19_03265 [Rubripirellula sp.]|nr:hypothetical protein [Rubripirellula sp.]MDB4339111.1 hypothetical protein [Rubripirellula sp.]
MNEVIQDVVANRKNNHPEYDAEAGDGQFNNADHTVDALILPIFCAELSQGKPLTKSDKELIIRGIQEPHSRTPPNDLVKPVRICIPFLAAIGVKLTREQFFVVPTPRSHR